MNYLAFDTSGTFLTVTAKGKDSFFNHIKECTRSHSVILMDEIENCLEKASLELADVDVFACSVGPGSFTGIRIGVATAKAFAYALSKKVLAVTSFLALAYNVTDNTDKLTLVNARHDNYYACGFNANNEVILPPCFLTKEEVLAKKDGFTVISDTEVEGENFIVGDIAEGFRLAVEDNLDKASFDVESLVPLYVKKSQAEEELC
ncbi:MAG: tRNA (adenosine(37)-N6)-threonylcarbamoyltransferase complex dimerization subunit type 1 TsaB [Clostridiales bacterium]|nr:tRNA (adenosine(37)-N6)-threonylcarbamoyltransferase complex dimerization subunit type 1 TsaB [Clostridiales bacterium]